MNDFERELIRCVVDGDIRRAQKQVKLVLDHISTEKDRRFKESELRRLANIGPKIIQLPANCEHIMIGQDVTDFPEERFLIRPAEQKLIVDLMNTRKAALRLQEMGIHYTATALITGEPGTGKTELARYIAHKLNVPFVMLKMSGIIDSLLGKTQRNIGQVFDYARNSPCVLCIDEIDAIGMARGQQNDSGEMTRITISLMQELDNVKNNVCVIACTNRPDKIDKALFRRFTFVHEVEPLKESDIEILVSKFFESTGYEISSQERGKIIEKLGEKSPASAVIAVCTDHIVEKIVAETVTAES